MKIVSAEYIKSFTSVASIDLPIFPTIAFIGRSNVGKSTLINNLVNRNKLVKTSSVPGKTQMLNFFLINNAYYFVDLPGYGYAKVPNKIKMQLDILINDFITLYEPLKLLFQLLDVRHHPSNEDKKFFSSYNIYNIEFQIIANKVDKLKKNQIPTMLKNIQAGLQTEQKLLIHSHKEPRLKQALWQKIIEVL